jgi:hypothetical protein
LAQLIAAGEAGQALKYTPFDRAFKELAEVYDELKQRGATVGQLYGYAAIPSLHCVFICFALVIISLHSVFIFIFTSSFFRFSFFSSILICLVR